MGYIRLYLNFQGTLYLIDSFEFGNPVRILKILNLKSVNTIIYILNTGCSVQMSFITCTTESLQYSKCIWSFKFNRCEHETYIKRSVTIKNDFNISNILISSGVTDTKSKRSRCIEYALPFAMIVVLSVSLVVWLIKRKQKK
ncbi:unnamed protein product [Schistosoma turkestanicum]|nr:unnamed protein product [Schistosoma turkestanicum]